MKHNSTFFQCVVNQSSCFSDLAKTWPQFPICPEIHSPTCCAEKHAAIENTIQTFSGEFWYLMMV